MENNKTNSQNFKKILAIFSFCLFLVPFTTQVKAQSTSTLTAIPPKVQLTGAPGENLQETIKVRNDSEQEIVINSISKDFIVKDDKGTPIPVEEEVATRWSLSSWMQISPDKALMKPGDTQPVNVLIQIPQDATPGGHYAMILHSPDYSATMGQTGSKLSQNVGTLVYLTVEGDITENAEITRFETDKKMAEYGPINLTTEIENLSDVHIRPKGSIKVYNMLKQKVTDLNLEEVNIFPFQSRVLENEFPGKWRLGRYQAVLTTQYGSTNKTLQAMVYFWIIPWKLITLILAVILTIIILLVTRKKKLDKPTSPPPVEEIKTEE